MSILIKGIPLGGYEISIMKDGERYRARVDGIWCEVEEIPITDSDTISRAKAIEALKQQAEAMSEWSDRYAEQRKGILTAVNIVEDLQPTQPERIKGRWISADAIFGGEPFYCSKCGENTRDTVMGKPRWNFCPNCGADMREVTQ